MARYTLGLDLGSNSVGWALVAQHGEVFENGRCILAGIRVFPAGLAMEKDKVGTPRGQDRRQKRSQRRTVRRREQRIRKLRRILQEARLLPEDRETFNQLAMKQQNPYLLRARGVQEALEPYEFGRAIFHLGHRRGFKSNKRITKTKQNENDEKENAEAKEEQEANEAGKSLQEHLHKEGITLGQYLAQFAVDDASEEERKEAHKVPQGKKEWIRNRDRNPHYNRRTLRSMYEEEFKRLWSKQAEFHPGLLTDELKTRVCKAIFTQGRVWWPLDSIGTCELTGDRRCPKGHWEGQEFRMLQEINNLRVYDKRTRKERLLEPHERNLLQEELRQKKSRPLKDIRQKVLGLQPHESFRGFEENADRDRLAGNAVQAAFAESSLAEWYAALPADRRAELHDLLAALKIDKEKNRAYGIDEDSLRAKAHEWEFSPDQANELVEVQQGLPDGHFQFSLKAIRKLLPHLQQGLRVDEAIAAANLKRQPKPAGLDRLPPVKEFDPYLTNPLVCRALTEARKIVNMLVEEHGKPNEIVIELAREMRQSRKHRREIQAQIKENERRNKEAEAEIAKAGGDPQSGEARRRYKLWKEYRDTCADPALCPYCGTKIPADKHTGWISAKFEVDHIIPRSRRPGDNGFNNLILCCAQCNQAKGSQTPYEWLGPEPERYDEMLRRVQKLPDPKRDRFHPQTPDDLETAIHTLIDATDPLLKATQHTSRAAVAYLQSLYPEEEQRTRIRCVKGFTTYDMRGFWGLNARALGLGPADNKNRRDHRHHAIDAITVALTTRKHVHNLSNAYARLERKQRPDMPPPEPWPDRESFRQDVQEVMDEIGKGEKIGVSFRPDHKVGRLARRPSDGPIIHPAAAGSLHAETGYGPVWNDKSKGIRDKHHYVTRKFLADLTPHMINNDHSIRDPAIRDIIRAECVSRQMAEEAPPNSKDRWQYEGRWYHVKKKPGKKLLDPPPMLPCKKGGAIPIKRVRLLVVSTKAERLRKDAGRPAKFALPEKELGNHHLEIYQKSDGSWAGHCISRFQAHKRLREGKPLVNRQVHPNGAEFVMWLCINDLVQLLDPNTGAPTLYRVQKISSGSHMLVLRLHTAARIDDKESAGPTDACNQLRLWRMQKVNVDPLGRVFPCDERV